VDDPFGDERLQFFLRHREDIRAWAAIEKEVIEATRGILAGLQTDIDERLAAIDSDVTTARRDSASYERIMARRPVWPDWVGVTLEWETGVDPFGSRLPKYGVFVPPNSDLDAARDRMVALAKAAPAFTSAGFRVPGGQVWPIVRWVPKSKDWWRDLNGWTEPIVQGIVDLWPKAAPMIDESLQES
jgi:hypothetical protein